MTRILYPFFFIVCFAFSACARHASDKMALEGNACLNSVECWANTNGKVCSNNSCLACKSDHECTSDLLYGDNATCQEGLCLPSLCTGTDCTKMPSSDAIACGDKNRMCETSPYSHCSGCIDGFVDIDGACVEHLTCAKNPCLSTETCVDYIDHPRECSSLTQNKCPENSVLHMNQKDCIACTPSCAEQTAIGSNGQIVPIAINGTQCACQTKSDFFLSMGSNGAETKIVPCDADGDGWVRDTLLGLSTFPSTLSSQEIYKNNHCTLRFITAFEIRDENNRVVGREVPSVPIPMIESTRNDDDTRIFELSKYPLAATHLPFLNADKTTLISAKNINALTKLCVDTRADFNDNGIPDIEERHEDLTSEYTKVLLDHSSIGSLLSQVTYFSELFNGKFVIERSLDTWTHQGRNLGGKSEYGTYIIQEKSRISQDTQDKLPLTSLLNSAVPAEGNEDGLYGNNYWKMCTRIQNETYSNTSNSVSKPPYYGMDFMRYIPSHTTLLNGLMNRESRPIFGHSSQFSCVSLDNVSIRRASYMKTTSDFQNNLAIIANECTFQPQKTYARNKQVEPIDMSCVGSAIPASNTWVGFVANNYIKNQTVAQRGCVNESVYFSHWCPGGLFSMIQGSADTAGNDDDFGRLLCGCKVQFGGLNCDNPCSDTNVHTTATHKNFPASQRDYWLCGKTTTSADTQQQFSSSAYTINGSISEHAGSELIRGSSKDGNEYSILPGSYISP